MYVKKREKVIKEQREERKERKKERDKHSHKKRKREKEKSRQRKKESENDREIKASMKFHNSILIQKTTQLRFSLCIYIYVYRIDYIAH